MAFSLIAHVAASGGANGVTTGPIDTTAANLLVISVAWVSGGSSGFAVSDSKSNGYASRTIQNNTVTANQIFDIAGSPGVGSGHTFTVSGTNVFPSIQVSAWSGAAASTFDVENGVNGTSLQSTASTGGVFPGQDNELVILGLDFDNNTAGAVSINGGFTITDTNAYAAGNAEGGSMAYLIQTTAASANPTWNWTNNTSFWAATIATYKAAAASSVFIPIIGRGPGLALAGGRGLAG